MDSLGKIVALVPAASGAICSLSYQVPVAGSIASLFLGDGQLMLCQLFLWAMWGTLWKSLA